MYSACGNAALPALGFPIRASADHRLFSASPRLIAAVHALHRLLVPRHPPCALLILTVITHPANRTRGDTRYIGKTVQFSRTAQKTPAGLAAGLSKLNSMQAPRKRSALSKLGRHARSRRRSRSAVCRPGEPAAPILELPRKEVIQPHLPVRLPCYDFTPVTSPTFDCSLPCGLGHRLRVLLASVV